jgi:hypothetical protein
VKKRPVFQRMPLEGVSIALIRDDLRNIYVSATVSDLFLSKFQNMTERVYLGFGGRVDCYRTEDVYTGSDAHQERDRRGIRVCARALRG